MNGWVELLCPSFVGLCVVASYLFVYTLGRQQGRRESNAEPNGV